MMKSIVLMSLVAWGAGCGGEPLEDETPAQAQRCVELRAHLVELRLAPITNLGKDLEQHRAALTQALGAEFLSSCATAMTDSQVACALAAKDLEAADACTAQSNGN